MITSVGGKVSVEMGIGTYCCMLCVCALIGFGLGWVANGQHAKRTDTKISMSMMIDKVEAVYYDGKTTHIGYRSNDGDMCNTTVTDTPFGIDYTYNIPNGYMLRVLKAVDSKHVSVTLDAGNEAAK